MRRTTKRSQDADARLRTSVRLLNVLAAGVLTGNELGSKLIVHPALDALPPKAHMATEQALTRRYGQVMPFAMSGTLVSFLPVLALDPPPKSWRSRMSVAGMGCYAAMLGLTLTRNLPINAQLLALDPETTAYEEFEALRTRWERLHTIRNVLDVAGFGLTVLSAMAPADPAGSRRRGNRFRR